MYAITGVSGQVGGVVASSLLAAGERVRAVVRNPARAPRASEVVVAEMSDAAALRQAFSGVDGVFVLLPPNFDPSPGFPESRRIIAALHEALDAARPPRIVVLSTIGAQAREENLLTQLQLLEQSLGRLPLPVRFLRAAWFIDNAAGDIAAARATGEIASFLQPMDRPVPMVAAADVGRTAAAMLRDAAPGPRVVELEGPERITPDMLAAALGRVLGRDVVSRAVPRKGWEALFRSQGMKNPLPRMRMLDGFNAGWIDFELGEVQRIRGRTGLDAVLRGLVDRVG